MIAVTPGTALIVKPELTYPDLFTTNVLLVVIVGCSRMSLAPQGGCFDRYKPVFELECRDHGIHEQAECERQIHNAFYVACNHWSQDYPGEVKLCDDYMYYEPPPMPITTSTTTTRPPPTSTTTTTTTTEEPTAAPFPILPTIGAFFGGALLSAIISIVIFIIWKKKKAKKTAAPEAPKKAKTGPKK